MRKEAIKKLKTESFDVLVIGGGATGVGIALDAATRGMKIALVEAQDFGSGTSSRSTKLIHGGVRYLERAITRFDWKQFLLVKDALKERSTLLKIAPHLTKQIPILIPTYSLFEKLYYGLGMKVYDWMAGSKRLKMSYFISKQEALELFPHLKQKDLTGGVIYTDGQFNDARMNLSIALTAASHGAAIANYVEVVSLQKQKVTVKDKLTGDEWEIQAKQIVNATGPFADTIRQLDDQGVKSRIKGSVGTHIVLDRKYCSSQTGVLIPKTADGRVLFLLPWEGSTLVGTTDIPIKITHDPKPSEDEIEYLLAHLKKYFDVTLEQKDIKSSWSGIRPLIMPRRAKSTSKLSRDFKIEVSKSGLYTIMGGKWTTYRKMAEALVDELTDEKCITETTPIYGGENYSRGILDDVDLDQDIREHLVRAYGDRAPELTKDKTLLKRLAEGYPYIEAEVVHAIKEEYACTPEDILHRRTRLATLDKKAASKALPRVIELINQHPPS